MTAPKPKPPADSTGITEESSVGLPAEEVVEPEPDVVEPEPDVVEPEPDVVEPEPEAKVKARFAGIEPVLAHFDGTRVIVEPGDLIMVSAEQLEQNPDFQPWED